MKGLKLLHKLNRLLQSQFLLCIKLLQRLNKLLQSQILLCMKLLQTPKILYIKLLQMPRNRKQSLKNETVSGKE